MKLIGIDLDGTLEDSRNDMVSSARRVRAALQLPARPDAELRPHVNGGMDHLYRACFDDYLAGHEARYAEVRETYEADYLEHVAVQTYLYDGIASALRALARLGTLACITNKPERISRRLLDVLDVGKLFGTVVGGDSAPHAKPHPSMLQLAAERCGFYDDARRSAAGFHARGRAYMIGDTNADIQLGRAFGAVTIWCAWGYAASISEAPDHRASTPADLPGFVAD